MSISARGFEQRILQVQKSTAFGESKNGSFITKTCGVDDARLKTSVSTPSTEAPYVMPESFRYDSNPSPKNGYHFATLMNGYSNGFNSGASLNGYRAEYNLNTTCNGFYSTFKNDTRPEKTVGHGRPKIPSQSSRIRSFSDSSSSNHYRTIYSRKAPEHKKTPVLPLHSEASVNTSDSSFTQEEMVNGVIWMRSSSRAMFDDRDLLCQSSVSPPASISHISSVGTVDQYQRNGRSRSFPESKQGTEHYFRERIPRPRTNPENCVRHFEVAGESKHESKFCFNGWNHNFFSPSETSLNDEPSLGDMKIIWLTLQNNGPMTSSEIMASVGPETKGQVNNCLYQLNRKGIVHISNGNPPLWNICQRFPYQSNGGPGVIGAERKQDKLFRLRGNYEDIPERPRRHSFNASENRPRKETQAVDNLRPWVKTNGSFSSPGERNASHYCKLCRIPIISEAQFEEHLRSTKHQNKIAKINAVPYKKFCEYCKVHLNSESQAKEHFSSGRHEQTVAKSQKAPRKPHLPLITTSDEETLQSETKSKPYRYHFELYSKAMRTNAVFFLPSGSGNALVAALVIERMLMLNPSRQVIFLVDRVLLVLQQSDYLRRELAHVRMPDEDSSNSFNGTRPIRIGAVCGEMRKLEGNARVYEQDVLIITADCYRNHLNNGTLRFEDVSLIVLDEAHHCNKDHPYNVIIRDFYFREDDLLGHRPKVLGMTASPAGEISLDKTTKKLQRLLGNLGDAKLLTVTEWVEELEEKTSKASPECISTSYTHSEKKLMEILMEYITKAFNLAVRLSEMKDYKDIFQPSSGGLFSIDDIHPVLRVIDNIVCSRPESNALSSLLHFQLVCETVCALLECGEKIALNHLQELTVEGCPHGFHWAEKMGLDCSKIWMHLEAIMTQSASWDSEFDDFASGVEQLIKLLLKSNWSGPCSWINGCILVLVNRRRTARYLAQCLSNCRELLMNNVHTTCLVSYGHEPHEEVSELAILKQRELISQIGDGYCQVVVATNVSEEGLDLPGCQLVVVMNPSGSTQALEHMRSRSRLKDARFVSICRNDDQAKKIEDLLKREENMKRAARIINGM